MFIAEDHDNAQRAGALANAGVSADEFRRRSEGLLAADIVAASADIAKEKAQAKKKIRERDIAEFEAAFTQPDAEAVIDDGPWAGFTRADATAWCFNLFQYEPRGFVHPGSQLRSEALTQLRAGGLPAVFGYAERARELTRNGLTPRTYREVREALGTPLFDPADVVMRGR